MPQGLMGCLTAVFLVFNTTAFAGEICEVVRFSTYEESGTEFVRGVPVPVIEKCVQVTIRNKDWRSRWATDFEVTVTFEDGTERTRRIEGEKDRLVKLDVGMEHETALCFGSSEHKIIKADCGF